MDLMNLLQGQLSQGLVEQLGKQVGAKDKDQTMAAITGIMTTLTGAMAQNASKPEGAASLANALDRDHDGSVLNNIMGMLSGQVQPANNSALNGEGIVRHILGDKQNAAVSMISQMSGLDQSKTGSLMTMLAPIIMGTLGQTKRQEGLDVAGLASLLTGTVTQQKSSNPTMDLVTRFLDKDGDGSIVDDLAGMGMKMLGGFFKKK